MTAIERPHGKDAPLIGDEPMVELFRTPKSGSAYMLVRPETADHNNLYSCLTEDEYGLRGISLGAGIALDVGAHIGGVTVGMAMDNPEARVIAVEALSANVELLAQNVERNHCRNVTVMHAAAAAPGTKTATVQWDFDGSESGRHHRFIGNAQNIGAKGGSEEKVRAVSLGEIVAEHGPIDFMKIDIEGGEYAFLDTPAVKDVDQIVGEHHDGIARIHAMLDATHDVTVTSGNDQFGGFRARRRTE